MHSEAISEPVQTGAWIADVTYEPAASQLESANNLKQLGIAIIHYDGSPEPVTYAGWGHFELQLVGHSSSHLRSNRLISRPCASTRAEPDCAPRRAISR